MKRKRLFSAVLAAVVCITSFMTAGCNKIVDEGTDKFVSADDPWYSIKKVNIAERFTNDPTIEGLGTNFVGIEGDRMVFFMSGNHYAPAGQEVNWQDISFSSIDIYKKDGTFEKTVDIDKIISETDDLYKPSEEEMEKYQAGYKKLLNDPNAVYEYKADWMIDGGVKLRDGKLVFSASNFIPTYDFMDFKNLTEEFTVDIDSGKVLSHKKSESKLNTSTDKIYNYEGYIIETVYEYLMESMTVKFNVTDPEGKQSVIELGSLIKDVSVGYLNGMMYLGEGKVLVSVPGQGFNNLFYEVDLKKGTAAPYLKDVSRIENDFWLTTYVNGIGNIIIDTDGIKSVNIPENKVDKLLSFDECNVNRMGSSFMELLTIDGETIYLASTFELRSQYYVGNANNPYYLHILTKEKTNPNAGKKIITVASLNNLSYAAYDAICRYNDTNTEYYIKIDDKYSYDKRINDGELNYNDDDFSQKADKLMSDLSYQLKTDLMAGDGPDMVMDVASVSHLDNGDVFLDLKKEVGTNGLFGNIVKASEKNGKIYNFPVSVRIKGILTNKSDVKSNQAGFTYDQYKEFVKGPCNGKDPIASGQLEYFRTCLGGIMEKFIKDNKADFNKDEFRILAEYVKENVIEQEIDPESSIIGAVESKAFKPTYESFMSFPYFVYRYSDNISNLKVLGIPSQDGRGPDLYINSSVAVSVNSKEKRACIEFIKTLLSDEVQEDFVYRDGIVPVKKAAYEKTANGIVEEYNATYEKLKDQYTPEQLVEWGYPWHSVEDSAVKDFETMIESCKAAPVEDPGIILIIDEEMPAYFAGQKSLDQVITIINDRARTYLNERG